MEEEVMPEQKKAPQRRDEGKSDEVEVEKVKKAGKKSPEDLDKLLDEIDEILEENAEEFVKSYVQRGGE